ncbi:MAG: PEP-CTERM sorting domain-containing protein [Acidobacteriaceae bacterium]|nr:PEP-CTERM sorting domain-containing protein [Acidobacteriaceae bacterium]MBV9036907.1 PEP-CTERM sorting domain-containing protein [Acidobacteriaceae bacterium]
MNYDFRLFETDGVTPVAVAELPEPSSFALLGVALLGCGCWRKYRR